MASDYRESMNKKREKRDSFVLRKNIVKKYTKIKMRIATVPSLCFDRVRMQCEHQAQKIQIG